MATFTLSVFFIFKLLCAFGGEGFLAMFCLWPINDQPTSKSQFVIFGIVSLLFIGWLFNWYSVSLIP